MNHGNLRVPCALLVGAMMGLFAGLVIGILRPTTVVHASATEGHDNFAIATGLIDNGVEGLFFLDYLSGELNAGVLNPKTGRFNSFFSYNIARDFGNVGRNPQYLMVTGLANFPRGNTQVPIGHSVVYIAEASTGNVAVYGIPWNPNSQASGRPQVANLILLDKRSFRTAWRPEQQPQQP